MMRNEEFIPNRPGIGFVGRGLAPAAHSSLTNSVGEDLCALPFLRSRRPYVYLLCSFAISPHKYMAIMTK